MGIVGALLVAMLFETTASAAPGGHSVHRSMNTAEFVALQRFSDAELRARFRLPPSCDPSLSAVRRATGRFDVTIVCGRYDRLRYREPPAATSRPRAGAGERRR